MQNKGSATLKYFTAVFIYGTIGYFLHFVNASSEFVVLCRGILGSSFILFVLLSNKHHFNFKKIRSHLLIMIISGISLGMNWLFLFAGYRYSVALASLCNYVAPIIVIVITGLIYGQKLNKVQIICVVLSFIGIVLVSGVLNSTEVDYHALIYGLLAAVGFVILVLCNKKLKSIDPLEKTFVQLFVSALTVLPYVIIKQSWPISLDTKSLLFIIMMGFFHTGIAYIFYFGSIDSLEPSKIAIIGYVEPVLSVLIGVLLLGEHMDVYMLIGGILIIFSALFSELFAGKE